MPRKKLVTALKQEIGIPIQLHTHDTSGNQVAAYLMAPRPAWTWWTAPSPPWPP